MTPTASHPAAAAPAASVESLTVRYGRTLALDGVSLAVARGSVHALLGRNGAGKSSLLRCLLGQRRPGAGRATLLGLDAWRERARAMRRVGVVPEEPDAPAAMTPVALVDFCSRLYPVWDRAGWTARLARFGVPPHTPFARLSKGQKGLVMLGIALGHRPELLILDDPTLGLDVVARNAVLEEVIDELAERGTTVLITSHDLQGIERIADRVSVLVSGRLVADEPLEALKARVRLLRYRGPASPGAELAPFTVLTAAAGPLGIEAVVADFDEARFSRLAGTAGIAGAAHQALALEDLFTALTCSPGGRS